VIDRYRSIERRLDFGTPDERRLALADWGAAKRELETWLTLAEIHTISILLLGWKTGERPYHSAIAVPVCAPGASLRTSR
jgi:hypothetical protein